MTLRAEVFHVSDRFALRRSRPVFAAGLRWLVAAAAPGCAEAPFEETTGEAMWGRLPGDVAGLMPVAAILCHEEETQGGAHRLWLLRNPGGTWMALTAKGRPGFEQHKMPATALGTILRSKRPDLDVGQPADRRCRYSHWSTKGGGEVHVREFVTDRGWFASVEAVRP